jgi:hypothetical protein
LLVLLMIMKAKMKAKKLILDELVSGATGTTGSG